MDKRRLAVIESVIGVFVLIASIAGCVFLEKMVFGNGVAGITAFVETCSEPNSGCTPGPLTGELAAFGNQLQGNIFLVGIGCTVIALIGLFFILDGLMRNSK